MKPVLKYLRQLFDEWLIHATMKLISDETFKHYASVFTNVSDYVKQELTKSSMPNFTLRRFEFDERCDVFTIIIEKDDRNIQTFKLSLEEVERSGLIDLSTLNTFLKNNAKAPFEIVKLENKLTIKCNTCGLTSFSPDDVLEKYCGFCNKFHDDEN